MGASIVRGLVVVAAILVTPLTGFAQDAILSGTVTDSTGAVMPGVTIEAMHEASGNTFVRGDRRAGRVSPGGADRRLPAHGDAAGILHASPERPRAAARAAGGGELADVAVRPGGVGDGDRRSRRSSTSPRRRSASNIDPRQMAEIPVNGRDWASLVVMAAGKPDERPGQRRAADAGRGARPPRLPAERRRAAGDAEHVARHEHGESALQPRRDRRVPVPVEPVRRDPGPVERVQVNVITKAGTNTASGLVLRLFPRRCLQRSRTFSAAPCCRIRTSS